MGTALIRELGIDSHRMGVGSWEMVGTMDPGIIMNDSQYSYSLVSTSKEVVLSINSPWALLGYRYFFKLVNLLAAG